MTQITLEQAKNALSRAKSNQELHEIGNDMYYSSYQYKEDRAEIEYWKMRVKELEK